VYPRTLPLHTLNSFPPLHGPDPSLMPCSIPLLFAIIRPSFKITNNRVLLTSRMPRLHQSPHPSSVYAPFRSCTKPKNQSHVFLSLLVSQHFKIHRLLPLHGPPFPIFSLAPPPNSSPLFFARICPSPMIANNTSILG
jgi:hypothetical protein